jgi:hypothetical protein
MINADGIKLLAEGSRSWQNPELYALQRLWRGRLADTILILLGMFDWAFSSEI